MKHSIVAVCGFDACFEPEHSKVIVPTFFRECPDLVVLTSFTSLLVAFPSYSICYSLSSLYFGEVKTTYPGFLKAAIT
jgi:hypothetical protein